jgi:hypothetical protein
VGNYREESGDSSEVQATISLVNVSWLVACLCTILVTNINHLFLLVFIVWHDNELNLKACFSFIMELSCPLLCWECVLGLHFVAKQKIDKVIYHWYHLHKLKGASWMVPNKKISFQFFWHYMIYDEHLQYHRNHIFWCKQKILV